MSKKYNSNVYTTRNTTIDDNRNQIQKYRIGGTSPIMITDEQSIPLVVRSELDNKQKTLQEWADDWKTRTTASKVLNQWNKTGVKPNPESPQEYTRRRIEEETKRTWLSDAADIAHGVGEAVISTNPYSAIPYFGAKVGQDIMYNNVGAHTALNASAPFMAFGINYVNPSSLLNRNIRTALYNNKIPYSYNLFDINVPKSFIEGGLKALKGEEVKQLATPKWFNGKKNFLGIPAGKAETLNQMSMDHRAAAWARYLGLNDNLQGVGYIRSRPGWVTKPTEPLKHKRYAELVTESEAINGGQLGGVISDKPVYNVAGNMGYKVNPTSNIARIFDRWDLQPFKGSGIPILENFEASQILPGAKPFT